MNHEEAVYLVRYAAACCPQQPVDDYTFDAWHDLLSDLRLDDCKKAVATVAQRQPFVSPSEIRAEVRRVRRDRLERTPPPAPPAALADHPDRYRQALADGLHAIADGLTLNRAIGPAPRQGEPPEEWQKARAGIGPAGEFLRPQHDPHAEALRQVSESRRLRTERNGNGGEPGAEFGSVDSGQQA